MDIKTKFDIGQTVYAVSKRFNITHTKCDMCNGNARFFIDEDKQYSVECPKCHGSGFIEKNNGIIYQIFTKSSVGKIIVERHHEREPKETYMLYSTGIDSGTLWNVEELFASEEEAKKYCEKMNK